MNKKEIVFRDPVVERVVDKFISRSNIGFEKYGITLEDEYTNNIKNLKNYVEDVQEELMDAVLYLQTVKELLNERDK